MKNNTWPGWECVRQLGAGSFGKVYEIQRIENGKTYKAALKVITIPQNEAEIENAYSEGMTKENVTTYFKSFVDDITNEFALMSDLKGYTNIVSYEDHMVLKHEEGIGWDILIRMELLTPLQKWVENHPMDENTIIRMGCDICRALELCHKKKIVHRDIKPENIFVNSNGDFKLGDFGIARVAEKTTSIMSQKGTFTYMAPEVYKGNSYNETVDIYSLGVVLYRFLNNNRTPFLPMGQITYNDRVTSLERRMSGEEIPEPLNGNEKLKKAILMAVHYDMEKRFQNVTAFRKVLEQCEGNGWNNEEPQTYHIADEPTYRKETVEEELTQRVKPKHIQTPKRKNKKILITSVAVLLGIVLIFILSGVLKEPAKNDETDITDQTITEDINTENEVQLEDYNERTTLDADFDGNKDTKETVAAYSTRIEDAYYINVQVSFEDGRTGSTLIPSVDPQNCDSVQLEVGKIKYNDRDSIVLQCLVYGSNYDAVKYHIFDVLPQNDSVALVEDDMFDNELAMLGIRVSALQKLDGNAIEYIEELGKFAVKIREARGNSDRQEDNEAHLWWDDWLNKWNVYGKITNDPYTAEEIVEKVKEYQKRNGLYECQFVEVDHKEENTIVIHCYDVVVDNPDTGEGHTATFDWYYINEYSLVGRNVLGEYFSLRD